MDLRIVESKGSGHKSTLGVESRAVKDDMRMVFFPVEAKSKKKEIISRITPELSSIICMTVGTARGNANF